jgi:hypothetical protein
MGSINDDDTEFTVRCNGKVFYINISPFHFHNSPVITAQYLKYAELIRSGEEEIDGVWDTDVYEWVTRSFEPLFADLAPEKSGNGKVTLHDYLFPEFFVCRLEAIDDQLVLRCVETQNLGHILLQCKNRMKVEA